MQMYLEISAIVRHKNCNEVFIQLNRPIRAPRETLLLAGFGVVSVADPARNLGGLRPNFDRAKKRMKNFPHKQVLILGETVRSAADF